MRSHREQRAKQKRKLLLRQMRRKKFPRRIIENGSAQQIKRSVLDYLKSREAIFDRDIWLRGQRYSLRKDERHWLGVLPRYA